MGQHYSALGREAHVPDEHALAAGEAPLELILAVLRFLDWPQRQQVFALSQRFWCVAG